MLPQFFHDVPLLADIGLLAEVPIELVELEELLFVSPVHRCGVIELETVPILVLQIEECSCSDQGFVNGVQFLPWNV